LGVALDTNILTYMYYFAHSVDEKKLKVIAGREIRHKIAKTI
jgi:hypothetical protein